MSELIAIGYPDAATAERAHAHLLGAAVVDHLVEVQDVVVILRHADGTFAVQEPDREQLAPAVGTGAVAGGFIGAALLAPLLGMALGAAAAGVAWKAMKEHHEAIPESFVDELRDQVTPGSAAVVALIDKWEPEKVLPRIREPGHVIQASLSPEARAELDAAYAAVRRQAG